MHRRILIIDDDDDYLPLLRRKVTGIGFNRVSTTSDPRKAISIFRRGGDDIDLALIDMTMPHMDGLEVLEWIKSRHPATECIMVTAVNEASAAVECLRKGAYDYLVKPIATETLALSIGRALEHRRLLQIIDIEKTEGSPRLVYADTFKPIITRSRRMLKVLKEAELHAQSDVPILITGESGTGKELLAKAIHCASPRSKYGFTPVNMASVSASLFESEFFGHTRGAFTGAERDRAGYLAYTDGGSLFLDEIGTLPLDLQGKLLRVLQDGEYAPVGTNNRRTANVRFIAATNEKLEELIAGRRFRRDLYYRIRGGWLHLPPLRERKEDIPLLIQRFLEEYCGTSGVCRMEEETKTALVNYDYPGNVRELKSAVQAAVNLCQGAPIGPACLPKGFCPENKNDMPVQGKNAPFAPLAAIERSHILKVYAHTGGNKSRTARILGIGLNTLRRKLKRYKR